MLKQKLTEAPSNNLSKRFEPSLHEFSRKGGEYKNSNKKLQMSVSEYRSKRYNGSFAVQPAQL